jgi:hypothetical protein
MHWRKMMGDSLSTGAALPTGTVTFLFTAYGVKTLIERNWGRNLNFFPDFSL